MSDILKSLLQAYDDQLTTEQAGTLSYVRHHAIVSPPLPDLALWYGELPIVLIQPVSVTLTPDAMEGAYRSNVKHYTITLTGALEYFDDDKGLMGNTTFSKKGAVDLAADLETIFDRKNFSLSQSCVLTGVTYNQMSLAQAPETGWIHTVTLTFDHLWIDRRLL